MPFKTKRRKLSAAQRRYTIAKNILVNYKSGQRDTDSQRGDFFEKQPQSKRKLIEENYGYVKSDLFKTLIFAGAIIAIQLFLLLKI